MSNVEILVLGGFLDYIAKIKEKSSLPTQT